MPMIMVIRPHHCETLDLAGLLEAIPPRHGERLDAWLQRTGTELEGDADALAKMFDVATSMVGSHFQRSEPLVDSMFLCQ